MIQDVLTSLVKRFGAVACDIFKHIHHVSHSIFHTMMPIVTFVNETVEGTESLLLQPLEITRC